MSLDKLPYKVWVLLGDSESAEGSVWEAFDRAAHYNLNNLIAIVDVNRLGQRGQTGLGWNTQAYAARARSFGWHAIEIDGHDLNQIDRAFGEAASINDRPTVIVAQTIKGRGFSFFENINGWHGKALKSEQAQQAIEELGGDRQTTLEVQKPEPQPPAATGTARPLQLPIYSLGDVETLRQAAQATDGNLIVIEDHWSEGGLGAAVANAFMGNDPVPPYIGTKLNITHLAVRDMPGSGQPEELLHAAKIDADAIVRAAKALLKDPVSAA